MFTPLDHTIRGVISFTWPMILISIIIVISIRFTDIINNQKKVILYKEIIYLLFIIYTLCLFQIVTFEDSKEYFINNNLIPFKEILRYKLGSRLFFKNVIGNLFMFIPYGFFVSYIVKKIKFYQIFLLTLLASFSIEYVQLTIGRVFDIDDIILNILGGILGYIFYHFIFKVKSSLPKIMVKKSFLNLMAILLLFLLMLYMVVLYR